jgi:hypothetical protein
MDVVAHDGVMHDLKALARGAQKGAPEKAHARCRAQAAEPAA